jgi:spore coat polysaccharide biosynthesis protein SpsF
VSDENSAVVFMQVRIGSTRLPGKALLPILPGLPSAALAMENFMGVGAQQVVLTDVPSAEDIERFALHTHYKVFVGAATNVLKRFYDASLIYDYPYIIRATADNLIVGPELARSALNMAMERHLDYFCYRHTPHGSGVEILSRKALHKVKTWALSSEEEEHVSPAIYGRPDLFRVWMPSAPVQWQGEHLRTTLDTQEDYYWLCTVFKTLYKGEPLNLEEYIEWANIKLGYCHEDIKLWR